jgi:hypothetical protein
MNSKDQSIKRLLVDLDFDRRGWTVVDHWEADAFAIGIASKPDPRRLVYVSTFRRAPGYFDFEAELQAGPVETDYRVLDRGENVSFEDLLKAIVRHLR